ncbi:LysR family transcriptional regulator [Lentibacter sp. XHP0401]|uniref:LysR family transcriptional regulator n=1 Tax=Lentibacter sp. XHP0401 TaxID=2984334 RepID=UPI0021E9267C|nr:LysR family transcriptional regulator [Lentibacter sp. XHP0401]MCV2892717.1 LysR family transcriptional regulator [Lentibacter sp. XHP0401]
MQRFLLPSEKAFRVFEACASKNSFTAAAEALGITQSAASQQIKQLEQRLGVRLFRKEGRGVVLTPAGHSILKAQRNAFESLWQAIENTREQEESLEVTLQVLPGFCVRWLLPRLSNFSRKHPEVDVTIVTDAGSSSFENSFADLTISYDMSRASGWLAQEALFPVASPAFAARHGLAGISSDALLAKLPELPLLGDTSTLISDTWRQWAGQYDTSISVGELRRFPQSNMSLLLAEHGQGIAMGRSFLVLDALVSGTLVELEGLRVQSAAGYTLRHNPDRIYSRGCKLFEQWLVNRVTKDLQCCQVV